ncbi:MAG: CotS family spore coat protein [Clostridiales bacterium]|nr:CotS family spore coat protein [Clostridiales bacterium]
MDEKIKEILDKYSFNVITTCRGRGAVICETDQGLRLVREYTLSPSRLVFESLVKYTVRDRGYMNVDQIVVNREGELLSKNKYDRGYVVKEWYDGRECDMKSREDLIALAANLARLHRQLRGVPLSPEMVQSYSYGGMKNILDKHCREMKSIRNYMRSKKQKKSFETMYLDCYEEFAGQALEAAQALGTPEYEELFTRAKEERTLCHGDYNHHNVILMKGRTEYTVPGCCNEKLPAMATVNFDKMNVNVQVNDLYLFLRKVMEKNHWDVALGTAIVDAYNAELPLSLNEKKYLYILMLFPEKFWKIANHYYNTRKSWTSARNQEKLEAFISIRELRKNFLDHFYRQLKNY